MKKSERAMLDLQNGDNTGMDRLVAIFGDGLHGYLFRETSSWQTAEDLTQDVFTKIFNHRLSYQPQSELKAWIYRIARNTLIDHFRRESIRSAVLFTDSENEKIAGCGLDYAATDDCSPFERIAIRELDEFIRKQLASGSIPADQAETLELVADGMSLPEIAARGGDLLPTTKSRLRLCREKLLPQVKAQLCSDSAV